MTTNASTRITIEQVASLSDQIIQEVEKAVVGKRQVLTQMMAAFLSTGGHILLEDYPGLAKTLIANSLLPPWGRASIASSSRRICCRATSPAVMCLTATRIRFNCAKGRCLPTSF